MIKQPNSRMCFICGLQNPIGLKMALYNDLDNRQVISTVSVPEHFNGYPGVVHGGIVATMLDEVAGRATLIDGDDGNLMVTLKIEVKYRQPTPTETPLTVIGRIVQPGTSRARAWRSSPARRHADGRSRAGAGAPARGIPPAVAG